MRRFGQAQRDLPHAEMLVDVPAEDLPHDLRFGLRHLDVGRDCVTPWNPAVAVGDLPPKHLALSRAKELAPAIPFRDLDALVFDGDRGARRRAPASWNSARWRARVASSSSRPASQGAAYPAGAEVVDPRKSASGAHCTRPDRSRKWLRQPVVRQIEGHSVTVRVSESSSTIQTGRVPATRLRWMTSPHPHGHIMAAHEK